jgi:hypothetical protein
MVGYLRLVRRKKETGSAAERGAAVPYPRENNHGQRIASAREKAEEEAQNDRRARKV